MRRTHRTVSVLVSLLAFAAVQPASGQYEVINPLLGPRWSQWLVGPLARMASEDEIAEFLLLEEDTDASAFAERFWSTKGRVSKKRLFDERAAAADKRFTEAAYSGRRTDRGTVFILYGEPDEVTYEQYRSVTDPDIEVWKYSKGASKGLDDKKPQRRYRFAREGDIVRFFTESSSNDPRSRRRQLIERTRPPF